MNFKAIYVGALCIILSACTTTPKAPDEEPDKPAVEVPDTETPEQPGIIIYPDSPEPVVTEPTPPEGVPEIYESGFSDLPFWGQSDPSPALNAFQTTCRVWLERDLDDWVSDKQKAYGRYRDWHTACESALETPVQRAFAMRFFQTHFEPVIHSEATAMRGLMTGYYIPLLDVRKKKDSVFSEPILAVPKNPKLQSLPRSQVSDKTADVIAYGKPIEVFFMHVQGSGRIRYKDGTIVRAAFAAHNNRPYVSIGKTLIKRGELNPDKASMDDLLAWMVKAGPEQTKALLNENPRYIYFRTEAVKDGIGPLGSMGVPLTGMGSLAVDPMFHPYGVPYWINTRLPQEAGDYKGQETGILLIAQDSGGAIKGEARGDVFFGFGHDAGEKAGVMKHEGRWTMFLPTTLAITGVN